MNWKLDCHLEYREESFEIVRSWKLTYIGGSYGQNGLNLDQGKSFQRSFKFQLIVPVNLVQQLKIKTGIKLEELPENIQNSRFLICFQGLQNLLLHLRDRYYNSQGNN
ncbi:unnamed protein product [Paramecium octaurelia]|uniref:Uncharacterized protein n=1 Tax=Paramecium octaurelia TaxID=43137 RepID=A0A8S1SMV8_PAROT|nr:unnamed protein product [Paramecium octaurelia]